jgi:aminopeptidase-like protein
VAEYKDYFDFALANQKRDPWLTAIGPAADPIKLEEERVGTQVNRVSLPEQAASTNIALKLVPLVRETVSDGMDIALSALAEQLPMTIHRYPTGMNCFDWILPEKWTCHEASLERMNGETVLSYAENPLFVRSYSLSYEGEVSRTDLLKHIVVHPTISKAVPYKQEFVGRDWGFCCSNEIRKSLTEDRYKVDIQTDFSYGELKVGEVMVPGNSSKTILICTYLDHPCQVNIALSGVLAGMEVIRARIKAKESRFSYRLLVLPGVPGFAAWLSRNQDIVPLIMGGLSLRMLSRSHPHLCQLSEAGETMLDGVCKELLKRRDPESQIVPASEVFNEFPGGGNPLSEEHGTWGNIPMVSLARALPRDDIDFPYRGYLTDLDNIENVDFNAMKETASIICEIIDVLERNSI